jgi:DNA-directed RNA polymerase specialized sigma24 family protein
MVPDPDEQRQGVAVLSGVPVKPAEEGSQVPESWLQEREHLSAAERVDRLAGDYELVTSLAWAGFEGPDYDRFATELARYGLAVIGGWIRRGLIIARCRERGFGGLPEPPTRAFDDPDTVEELANETVGKALHHFRKDVLLTGKWDCRRGASLRTYFIGQCLIRFANIYRLWLRVERSWSHIPADHTTLDVLERQQAAGPEDRVIDLAQVQRALGAVANPTVRHVLVLHAAGLSHREIGKQLNVSEKTVERMIANERDRMRKRGIA